MMRSTSIGTLAVGSRRAIRKDAILLEVEVIAHTNRVVCIWKVGFIQGEAAHVLAGFFGNAFTHSITAAPDGQ
jgi:hypothetical protein